MAQKNAQGKFIQELANPRAGDPSPKPDFNWHKAIIPNPPRKMEDLKVPRGPKKRSLVTEQLTQIKKRQEKFNGN